MKRLVAVLVACGSPPAHPVAMHDIPGLQWITPAQPWRSETGVWAIAVDGEHAIVATARGLVPLDLATGASGPLHPLDVNVDELVRLDARRWIGVGQGKAGVAAVVIDATTLTGRPIPLAPAKGADPAYPHAAVLADGSVVITGSGLPLAAYDPATWQQKRVIDPELSWEGVAADARAVYAAKSSHVTRFDLATGQRTDVGRGVELATADGLLVEHISGGSVRIAGTGTTMGSHETAFAVDAAGKRVAAIGKGVLHLYALPSGKDLASFTLGPSVSSGRPHLAFDGDRVVVASFGVIRVVDVATGTVTPAGQPPFNPAIELAVRGDGAVLAINQQAWRLVDGRVTATSDVSGVTLALPPGELRRYAVGNVRDDSVTLYSIDDPRPIRRWKLPGSGVGWLGDNGEIVVAGDSGSDKPARLLRSSGNEIVTVVAYTSQANVIDVDVDAGVALVERDGAAHVVSLRDGVVAPRPLRAPACTAEGGTIQRGGPLAALTDRNDVIVWKRTGEPVASLHAGDDAVDSVAFVPGRSELALDLDGGGFALWDFARGDVRRLQLDATFSTAVSPDARRVAVAFTNGRVAVVDLDALRATLPAAPAQAGTVPDLCKAVDPFAIPPDASGDDGWIPDPE